MRDRGDLCFCLEKQASSYIYIYVEKKNQNEKKEGVVVCVCLEGEGGGRKGVEARNAKCTLFSQYNLHNIMHNL